MRKHLIAANWKMYKTPAQALEFLRTFLPMIAAEQNCDLALFPSITSIPAVLTATMGSWLTVGAQDMHWMDEGAYTGETSPAMLVAIGVMHVLVGHSERRQYSNETDGSVNLKVKAALAHGMVPTICVGENEQERDGDRTEEVLGRQIGLALKGVVLPTGSELIFAYEPVWAIGTGRTATPEQAEASHRVIRSKIAEALGAEVAEATRILYGGSVKPENAASLCCMENIDGALIGGASLEPGSLAEIIAKSVPKK